MNDLDIVRHPRARTLRLSLDPVTGRARLTLPRRAALGPALAWAEGKRGWLVAQRACLPAARPFAHGTTITVADDVLAIRWTEGKRRGVVRHGATLDVQGPPDTLPRRIEAWLRGEALAVLSGDTADYATAAGVAITRVAVGDARGRWGSCASSGVIRYSWRLLLAPTWVRRATVAHEVAHRVHMNHGPAFHTLVAELFGADPTPARDWLRHHGAALHWVGRSAGAG